MKTANPIHVFRHGEAPAFQQQRGVTLVIALLVLVAMTLAGLALVRSVDTATLVAGNLAFRQSASASADRGMEAAIAGLRAVSAIPGSTENNGGTGSGYFATVPWNAAATPPGPATMDFTGNATPSNTADDFDWSTAKKVSGADSGGNTAYYVIHRLCQNTGALDPATCSTWQEERKPTATSGILTANEIYNPDPLKGTISDPRGLYRITVRIAGPRNTFNYVQAIVIV